MKKEYIEFVGELLSRITEAQKEFGVSRKCEIAVNHHQSKDCWTIDCLFERGNSKYEDCVVFYLDKDSFEPNEILEDFDEIVQKSKSLLK